MEAFLKDWFAYNHRANESIVEVLTTVDSLPARAYEIFSHLLNAHRIWLNRIYPVDGLQVHPWEKLDKEVFSKLNDQNYTNTLLFLQSTKFGLQLGKQVYYQNSRGVDFTNSIQEIYFHILNHSAYHRGQVALLLRQAAAEPPLTDYIFFKREMPV
ncbi:DinB family protein [Flammeovirgaceae bacterium 311]|nr:DinB family protein [Flammeovirgaceae bacterium 311]